MAQTTRHTKTNSATSIDVVIADPNSTVVLSQQQNLDECGSTNQPLSERRNRAGNQTGLVNGVVMFQDYRLVQLKGTMLCDH